MFLLLVLLSSVSNWVKWQAPYYFDKLTTCTVPVLWDNDLYSHSLMHVYILCR